MLMNAEKADGKKTLLQCIFITARQSSINKIEALPGCLLELEQVTEVFRRDSVHLQMLKELLQQLESL